MCVFCRYCVFHYSTSMMLNFNFANLYSTSVHFSYKYNKIITILVPDRILRKSVFFLFNKINVSFKFAIFSIYSFMWGEVQTSTSETTTQRTTTKATTNTKAMTRWATITSAIKATTAWKEFIMLRSIKSVTWYNIIFKCLVKKLKKKKMRWVPVFILKN